MLSINLIIFPLQVSYRCSSLISLSLLSRAHLRSNICRIFFSFNLPLRSSKFGLMYYLMKFLFTFHLRFLFKCCHWRTFQKKVLPIDITPWQTHLRPISTCINVTTNSWLKTTPLLGQATTLSCSRPHAEQYDCLNNGLKISNLFKKWKDHGIRQDKVKGPKCPSRLKNNETHSYVKIEHL